MWQHTSHTIYTVSLNKKRATFIFLITSWNTG